MRPIVHKLASIVLCRNFGYFNNFRANKNLKTLEGMREAIMKLQNIGEEVKGRYDSVRLGSRGKRAPVFYSSNSDAKNKTFYSASTATNNLKLRPFSAKIGGVKRYQPNMPRSRHNVFRMNTESIEEV